MKKSLQNLHAFLVLVRSEQLGDLLDLALQVVVVAALSGCGVLWLGRRRLINDKLRLNSLNLSFQKAESIWVCDIESITHILGQLLVRLAHLLATVSIRAIFSKMTHFLLLKVLADLRLVVVVRDVQHLVLHLKWKLL